MSETMWERRPISHSENLDNLQEMGFPRFESALSLISNKFDLYQCVEILSEQFKVEPNVLKVISQFFFLFFSKIHQQKAVESRKYFLGYFGISG